MGSRSYTSPLRAEQAAATRDRVVDAAIDLLQEADPGVFGMQDVADRAGVSLRIVYRAFEAVMPIASAVVTEVGA